MKWGKKKNILFPVQMLHGLPLQGASYKLQSLSKWQQAPCFPLQCQGFSFRLTRRQSYNVLAWPQLR